MLTESLNKKLNYEQNQRNVELEFMSKLKKDLVEEKK